MATYKIEVIHQTFERLLGSEITIPDLEKELDKQDWIPQDDQMIVTSKTERSLPSSNEYGRFIEFDNQIYRTTAGNGKFARPLTPEEIAQCF
ncbi:MAG: hypothetical protein DRJ15_17385 [Bacteroidetes bacterium]|nr:MAG: hypothetical protein DRJ15_17385 [Bacteroidota bacterium]